MFLNESFIENTINIHEERGKEWLQELPNLIRKYSKFWNFKFKEPLRNLSFNFVSTAVRDEKEIIFKAGVPCQELFDEIKALKTFKGNIVTILEESSDGVFLLEKLSPGEDLTTVSEDKAIETAASVMQSLWMKSEENFKTAKKINNVLTFKKEEILETKLIEKRDLEKAIFIEEQMSHDYYLIHGDLHHYNILKSDDSWKAIDPKGYLAPKEYEIAPFLKNNLKDDIENTVKRRIERFSEILNFDRKKLIDFAFLQTLLSAWWSIDDNTPEHKVYIPLYQLIGNFK